MKDISTLFLGLNLRKRTSRHSPINFRKRTAHLIGFNNADPNRESVLSLVLLHRKVRVSYRPAQIEPTGIQFLLWGHFGRADPCWHRDLYPCPPAEGWVKHGASEHGTDFQSERSKEANQRCMVGFSSSPEKFCSTEVSLFHWCKRSTISHIIS